jgi:hypothetical protein
VETNKKIVILTDGAAPVQEMAENIAAIIGAFPDYSAAVIQAKDFSGTDFLAAHAVFLGCQEPQPASFASIQAFLGHINLAGRPCGLFSSGARALEYLAALVHDSEIAADRPFQTENDTIDREKLKNWVQDILKRIK